LSTRSFSRRINHSIHELLTGLCILLSLLLFSAWPSLLPLIFKWSGPILMSVLYEERERQRPWKNNTSFLISCKNSPSVPTFLPRLTSVYVKASVYSTPGTNIIRSGSSSKSLVYCSFREPTGSLLTPVQDVQLEVFETVHMQQQSCWVYLPMKAINPSTRGLLISFHSRAIPRLRIPCYTLNEKRGTDITPFTPIHAADDQSSSSGQL
jgi:hypothetical protein